MDEIVIEELTGPSNPDDFVGRTEILDRYADLLREFVRGNDTVRWVHISGVAGVGKSSLLRKLRMMAERERIATASVEVPVSPLKANKFLTEIKFVLDEIGPEWRSFVQRRMNSKISEVSLPPEHFDKEVTEQALVEMTDSFFADLDKVDEAMKRERQRHGFFLDDLDRLLSYDYISILKVIPRIAKQLREKNMSLLFVTTSHYNANKLLEIQEDSEYVIHLSLAQFDFKEAEVMIRRRGKLVKTQRELVVQTSTRFPFDLSLRQMIMTKELDPTTLDANVITETFGLTHEEVELLKSLARSEKNFFDIENYKHSNELINRLKDQLLFLVSSDNTFAFDSYAVWELISHVFKPIDPRTEVILTLNRLRDQAELGQMPSTRDYKIVEEHLRGISDNALIFEISGQLADTAKAALNGSLIYTAWELLQLATLGLTKTGDFEKIADLQENVAKGFAKVDQEYLAAKAFEAAGYYFSQANIDWRSVSNYRDAAQNYRKEVDKTDLKIYHYAIRSMFQNCINAFVKANESRQAKRAIDDARELFKEYPHHVKFFDELEVVE